MRSLAPDFSQKDQDTYIEAVQARTTILTQLNDVRRDPKALEAAGVTVDQVRAAFEAVWAVAAFYEKNLWHDAEQERKANKVIAESLRHRFGFAPVPASDVVGETA